MSWRDYERLIRERNADTEAWLSAEEGNPNTPEDALRLAIEESDPDDVRAMLEGLKRAKQRLYSHAASQADYGNWEPTTQYQALSKAIVTIESSQAGTLEDLDDIVDMLGLEWIQDDWIET